MPLNKLEKVTLTSSRRIHIVGIGGAGMGAMAGVLSDMGHRVSGSDLQGSPLLDRLSTMGVQIFIGHDKDNIGDAEILTFSPAIPSENEERIAGEESNCLVLERREMLALICATKKTLAVSGTHGKTTTSSMLALMLVRAGLHPSFIIGADINDLGTNAIYDDGDWMVLEADESYGAFATLHPQCSLITNVEADHLDHYNNFETLQKAFLDLLGESTESVVHGDDPVALLLGKKAGSLIVGQDPTFDVVMSQVNLFRLHSTFRLEGHGCDDTYQVSVPGLHNAKNAALAAVGAIKVGASTESVSQALMSFAGVPRRFEFRGEQDGVTFIDDYAHLPTEVRAALATARGGGFARVVCVFQPHRYTRTRALAPSFADSFVDADLVVVTDIYSAGEAPVPGINGKLVADAVGAHTPSKKVIYIPERDRLAEVVVDLLQDGDVYLTLGAGDLTLLPDEIFVDER